MVRTFVDTPVFLRMHDDAAGMRSSRDAARRLLSDGNRALVTSPLVLGQIYASLTAGRTGAARKRAESNARDMVALAEGIATLPLDRRVLSYTMDLLTRRQMQLWDAVLWSTAILGGCDEYASFDAPGNPRLVDGVRFVNPLELAN